ncbi:MAG: ROK family protein, partial [Clostridia bacterium]|nr:ROK family protein [Clostridia bacterium]
MMVGFDIGGTKCAVSVGFEENGTLHITDKRVMATDHTISAYEMLEKMCKAAEEMTDDFSVIGVSCGGPLDAVKGVVLSPPNLPGWDEIAVVDYLHNRYGGKAALQNDANACALAEWQYGAGKGTRNMIFLTFGSGLGAGLILDGKLYSGTNDMAGEVGHIRIAENGPVGYGKAGSLEGFCSGNGIAQTARAIVKDRLSRGETVAFCTSLDNIDTITAKLVGDYAENGDPLAIEIYRRCAEKLGLGLSFLIDILNP